MLPLIGVLLGVACAWAPRHGEVVLLSGTGAACPREHGSESALALLHDGAELPSALSDADVLVITAGGARIGRETLDRLRKASAVHLVGGTALGWWQVMTDHGKRSALQRGVLASHARGAALIGWGAGAEFLAGAWLAPSVELEAAGFRLRNPRRAGMVERVSYGLGLAPAGLLVQGEEERLEEQDQQALVRHQASARARAYVEEDAIRPPVAARQR